MCGRLKFDWPTSSWYFLWYFSGSKVLSKFPQDSRKTTIDFCDIGEGNTPEEVSRLFLSSLMLANAQNVEIGCSAPKNETLPMDQVSYDLF